MEQLIKEAQRLFVDTLYSEKGHFVAGRRWRSIHRWLGITAVISATVAGSIVLAGVDPIIPALLSLFSGSLGAINTFVDPASKSSAHDSAGVRYAQLRRKLRQFVSIDGPSSEEAHARADLRELTEELGSLQETSPGIAECDYTSAKLSIQRGSAEYTDCELSLAKQ